jgi:hypothetical protein
MLAQITDDKDPNSYSVTKPVLVLIMPSIDRDTIGINLVGFVPTLSLWDNTFQLFRNNIVMQTTLKDDDPLLEKYNKLLDVYEGLPRTFKLEDSTPELLVEDDIEYTPKGRRMN